MRSSLVQRIVAVSGVIMLLAVSPVIGDDYLIIKKKSGSTQKVPLPVAPDQIESFQVESGPKTETPPPAPPAVPFEEQAPSLGLESAPPPVETKPGGPSVQRQSSGPVAAPAPGAKGEFTCNIYKLPENIVALPDYSAFRPVAVVSTDRIYLEPSKGENDPSGLPENTAGLGMRFVGTFLVSGEGIFKWRVYSKDGVRLHIDDKTLIEHDGIHEPSSKTAFIHLSEGIHTIILDSFNSAGPPVLKLFVQPPVGQEQVFSIGSGLAGWKEPAKPYDVLWGQVYFVPKGDYPEGPDLNRLSPIGRLVASDLNIFGEEGIPGLPGRKDMVSVRYQGFFNVTGAGIFAFRLVADYFARLSVGKHVVAEVNKSNRGDPKGVLGWAFLQEGSYPISVDYFHPSGTPRLELFVTQPVKEEELFSPSRTLAGFASDTGKVNLIPAFVYFLKPNTKKLPNLNQLSPAGMFFTKAIDFPVDRGSKEFPGVPKREDWLALRFYVKFSLSDQEAGTYKFRVVCKDSAQLLIGKTQVIKAEGIGKVQDQSGTVNLQAGSHEMFLDYLATTGPNGVQLFITPPGGQEKIFAFE